MQGNNGRLSPFSTFSPFPTNENIYPLFIVYRHVFGICTTVQKNGAKPAKKTTTTISLSENTFDFGYVNENGYVSKELTIRNTGTTDLYLGEIAALCVVADYTFAPIPPGKSSVIKVSFSTEGKVGEQYRAVSIGGNIENKEEAIIYIKGVVYPR